MWCKCRCAPMMLASSGLILCTSTHFITLLSGLFSENSLARASGRLTTLSTQVVLFGPKGQLYVKLKKTCMSIPATSQSNLVKVSPKSEGSLSGEVSVYIYLPRIHCCLNKVLFELLNSPIYVSCAQMFTLALPSVLFPSSNESFASEHGSVLACFCLACVCCFFNLGAQHSSGLATGVDLIFYSLFCLVWFVSHTIKGLFSPNKVVVRMYVYQKWRLISQITHPRSAVDWPCFFSFPFP